MSNFDSTETLEHTEDYSDEASTFGDRIVAAREALGISTTQLARRLGIKAQTLQNWEDDRSEPRANKLQMLAGVLNVSIIWLMSGEGAGPNGASTEPFELDMSSMLDELREIRKLQADLASRTMRLERRLIAHLR